MDVYYVYVFLDPRKPGRYSYSDITYLFEPFYVGKGKNNRYKRHLNISQLNSGNNPTKERKLKKIINLNYNPLDYVIILGLNLNELDSVNLEIKTISEIGRLINNGLLTNLTDGGEGFSGGVSNLKGKTYEEIFGLDLAEKLKKDKSERFKGTNNPMYGRKFSGRKLTQEQKDKLSKIKQKSIYQIDINTNQIIQKFESAKHASETLNIIMSGIHNCLSKNQKAKTSGGFIWKYVEDYDYD